MVSLQKKCALVDLLPINSTFDDPLQQFFNNSRSTPHNYSSQQQQYLSNSRKDAYQDPEKGTLTPWGADDEYYKKDGSGLKSTDSLDGDLNNDQMFAGLSNNNYGISQFSSAEISNSGGGGMDTSARTRETAATPSHSKKFHQFLQQSHHYKLKNQQRIKTPIIQTKESLILNNLTRDTGSTQNVQIAKQIVELQGFKVQEDVQSQKEIRIAAKQKEEIRVTQALELPSAMFNKAREVLKDKIERSKVPEFILLSNQIDPSKGRTPISRANLQGFSSMFSAHISPVREKSPLKKEDEVSSQKVLVQTESPRVVIVSFKNRSGSGNSSNQGTNNTKNIRQGQSEMKTIKKQEVVPQSTTEIVLKQDFYQQKSLLSLNRRGSQLTTAAAKQNDINKMASSSNNNPPTSPYFRPGRTISGHTNRIQSPGESPVVRNKVSLFNVLNERKANQGQSEKSSKEHYFSFANDQLVQQRSGSSHVSYSVKQLEDSSRTLPIHLFKNTKQNQQYQFQKSSNNHSSAWKQSYHAV